MAQVVGRRYSAMFGFENEADTAMGRGPDQESCCAGAQEIVPTPGIMAYKGGHQAAGKPSESRNPSVFSRSPTANVANMPATCQTCSRVQPFCKYIVMTV